MAKGYDRNQERKNTVADFGKDLAKRAKSKCEFCGADHVKLSVFEVPPAPPEPDIDRCIFICDHCKNILENLDKAKENDVRFITETVWSNTPIVKAVAVQVLKKLENKYYWADNLLEEVYLDDETLDFLEMIEL